MWHSPSFWQWWRCVDGSPTVWCIWKHVGRPGSGQWRRFRPWTSAWSWSEGWWWGKWTWSSSHTTCTLPANQVHWIISDHNVKFNYLGYHLMCCFFLWKIFLSVLLIKYYKKTFLHKIKSLHTYGKNNPKRGFLMQTTSYHNLTTLKIYDNC